MAVLVSNAPCVLFEDEHLLAVNKPPGWNTHSPSSYAGEGIYEWLRNREARWGKLAIIHRLDKETSGVLLFAKTELANRALTAQFTSRSVVKKYIFLTHSRPSRQQFKLKSALVRSGEKYFSRPIVAGSEVAETVFHLLREENGFFLMEAQPLTGRTHQIRVHAAECGVPILGDKLYDGEPFGRMCLHARELLLTHPASQEPLGLSAEPDFINSAAEQLRNAFIGEDTNAYRLLQGESDQQPGLYVEQWGEYLLPESETPLSGNQAKFVESILHNQKLRGAYHKTLKKSTGPQPMEQTAPKFIVGEPAPELFLIRENGVNFEISFQQGYSVGLFLDQRDNRRRLLTNYFGPAFAGFVSGLNGRRILNCFSYTCGFSVCAALSGAITTSLDLSKKYLDWGKRNFLANKLDPTGHDFIYGDVLDWAHRLAKKSRRFDLVLLDPPTFSRSKRGTFRAEKDYGQLVKSVLPLLAPDGVLFCSTNAQKLMPEDFLQIIKRVAIEAGRTPHEEFYCPQPPDFPVSKAEPAYLKTIWIRFGQSRSQNHKISFAGIGEALR
jgi:23S rRNA (cytosine1962-C5)-methyltransferase